MNCFNTCEFTRCENLPQAINCRAFCGANLVVSPPEEWGNEPFILRRVALMDLYNSPGKSNYGLLPGKRDQFDSGRNGIGGTLRSERGLSVGTP